MNDNCAQRGANSTAAGDPEVQSAGQQIPIEKPSLPKQTLPLLIVVEGQNDCEFLRRISAMIHATDNGMTDLSTLERQSKVVFVPFGGGDVQSWAYRLAPLQKSEFHLYDREVSPLRELRFAAARIVNLRPGCRAFITGKRSVESYLHPQAIYEASGIRIEFGDDDDVAELAAQERYLTHDPDRDWFELTSRCRRRLRNHSKQWLNRAAVDRMTAERLAERDPDGEVRNWLVAIVEMLDRLV